MIYKVFNKDDAEHILNIPISLLDREDNMIWTHNNNGQYTVANGYKILQQKERERKAKGAKRRGAVINKQTGNYGKHYRRCLLNIK